MRRKGISEEEIAGKTQKEAMSAYRLAGSRGQQPNEQGGLLTCLLSKRSKCYDHVPSLRQQVATYRQNPGATSSTSGFRNVPPSLFRTGQKTRDEQFSNETDCRKYLDHESRMGDIASKVTLTAFERDKAILLATAVLSGLPAIYTPVRCSTTAN